MSRLILFHSIFVRPNYFLFFYTVRPYPLPIARMEETIARVSRKVDREDAQSEVILRARSTFETGKVDMWGVERSSERAKPAHRGRATQIQMKSTHKK